MYLLPCPILSRSPGSPATSLRRWGGYWRKGGRVRTRTFEATRSERWTKPEFLDHAYRRFGRRSFRWSFAHNYCLKCHNGEGSSAGLTHKPGAAGQNVDSPLSQFRVVLPEATATQELPQNTSGTENRPVRAVLNRQCMPISLVFSAACNQQFARKDVPPGPLRL
jgi:hypothetical protein